MFYLIEMKNIVIIGGGINGLCVALKLAENFNKQYVKIKVISDKFSPNTTGDVAAGLWGPHLLGNTRDVDILKWSSETHDFFHDLWKRGLAQECGICLVPVIEITEEENYPDPIWKSIVFGYEKLSQEFLEKISSDHGVNYKNGISYVTFTCEPTKLMKFMTKKLKKFGVKFEKKQVKSFEEFSPSNCDLLINCTGLGSKKLARDEQVDAIRGQVVKIQAPWCYSVVMDDENYIIPNTESVTLGGTAQKGDYKLKVSIKDKVLIENGCYKMFPSLKNATFLSDKVGLRPARTSVRLEVEQYALTPTTHLNIVHNYGHGGSGITLAWGCASDVLRLSHNFIRSKSKL